MCISHTKLYIMLLKSVLLNFLTALVTGHNGKGYHNTIGIPAAERILEMEKNEVERDLDRRIAGGEPVPYHTIIYPWLAGVIAHLVNNTRSMCGASLLTADRLITAGHCWVDDEQKASQLEVVLGTVHLFCTELHCGGIRLNTSHVVTHPGWDPNIITSVDAAMIYLPHRIYFTSNIYPIALPFNDLMDSFDGCQAIVSGYGRIDGERYSSNVNPMLNHVEVKVISNEECIDRFNNPNIQPMHMCTSGEGGIGICQGDSGGPLVTIIDDRYTLIGVNVLGNLRGCNKSFPSVYLRITNLIDFILKNVDIENSI